MRAAATEAVRKTVRLGPFGPNAIGQITAGHAVWMTPPEAREIVDAVLEAIAPELAAQAAVIAAVTGLAEGWADRAAHSKKFADQVPEDIREHFTDNALDAEHRANLLFAALGGRQVDRDLREAPARVQVASDMGVHMGRQAYAIEEAKILVRALLESVRFTQADVATMVARAEPTEKSVVELLAGLAQETEIRAQMLLGLFDAQRAELPANSKVAPDSEFGDQGTN